MGLVERYFAAIFVLVVIGILFNWSLFCASTTELINREAAFLEQRVSQSSFSSSETIRPCTQPERRRSMAAACKKYPQLSNVTRDRRDGYHVFRNFIIDEKHKLLLCSIHKAGSSTLLRMLIWGTGKLGEQNPSADIDRFNQSFLESIGIKRLSSYPPKRQQEILNTYVKVINIRNPMSRLVSAYRDKFIKLRRGLTDIIGHVIRNYRNKKDVTAEQIAKESRKSPRLTIKEFARLVMDESAPYDLHWDTMIHHCYPCLIKYDYIIRQETMADDMEFMLKLLSTELKRKLELENWHSTDDVKVANETKLTGFASVVPELNEIPNYGLEALRSFYKQDMDVFGYDFNSEEKMADCSYELADGSKCC